MALIRPDEAVKSNRNSPSDTRAGSVSAFGTTPTEKPVASAWLAPGWGPALAMIGAAALILGAVFRGDIGGAIRVWIESTAYNHCFLILPLVGYLLWERRAVMASVSPRPSFWPLILMPLLSAGWLLAAILDIQEARQLILVAMFEVALLVVLGPRLVWLLLAPLLFLFFLVPSGAFLVPSLQKITADMSIAGLHALGIPVFSDGFMIEIPEGTFEVAEACAGLRFLIASTVFGCFFAIVMYRSVLRRIAFITLSILVPIAANGMRALGIIVVAHVQGSAAAVEADHILYGWLFFSLVIIILIAIGMTFAQKPALHIPVRFAEPRRPVTWRLAAAATGALMLAVAGPAYAARLNALYPPAPLPSARAPAVAAPWHVVSDPDADWHPTIAGADGEFFEAFDEPGSGVILRYIALYRLRAIGNLLTTTANRLVDDERWHIAGYGRAEASFGGRKVTVASTETVSGQRRRLVWSFYVVDGKIAAGLIETKLLQARALLFERAPVAAFVAISASMDDPNAPAERQLDRFLASSQPLPQYLEMLPR